MDRILCHRGYLGLFSWVLALVVLTTSSARAAAPVLVGAWPGSGRLTVAEDIAISAAIGAGGRPYAVIAGGVSGVFILDLGRPEIPRMVGFVETPGTASALALSGTTGFVADGLRGLSILDVADPSAPRLIGNTAVEGNVVDLAVVGSTAFLVTAEGIFWVYDVSSPGNPSAMARLDLGMGASRVMVSGARAYVAAAAGLQVLDVSNARSPFRLGLVRTTAAAEDVWLEGGYAYLLDSANGLSVVDLRDPTRPAVRGSFNPPGTGRRIVGYFPTGHVLVGDGPGGLVAINVTNPDAPTGRPGVATGGDTWAGVISGDLVCVLDRTGGMRILRVADPSQLGAGNVVGRWSTTGRALDVSADNAILCLADGQGGLRLWGFSDPSHPDLAPGPSLAAPAVALAQRDGRLLVGVDGNGFSGIEVLDIPTISGGQVRSRGRFLLSKLAQPEFEASAVAMAGDLGYLAAGRAGLLILDLTDPDNPRELSRVRVTGGAWGVAVRDGTAYVGAGVEGVAVVDVRTPNAASVLGRTPALVGGAFVRGVAVIGNRVFAASGLGGLWTTDVTDPASPRWLVSMGTAGTAVRIGHFGDLLVISAREGGITVLDVKEVTDVKLVGSFPTDGQAFGTAMARDQLFVADDSRLLVMALAGLTSGPNLAPSFEIISSPVVNEDSGPAEIRDWLRNIVAGPPSESWQSLEFSVTGSAPSLFAQTPTVSPDGTLRFHALTNAFGTARFVLRLRDNGGTANGGIDSFEREFTITVRAVNDPPIMDSPPDLGWRENSQGVTVLMSGLFVGPPNERPLQRLTVRAFSSRPDVIPHPIVDYKGGSEGRLLFGSFDTTYSGRSNAFLRIILEDDGGTENGGTNRAEVVRFLSVRPVNDPPRVEITDPVDGAVIDPLFTSYTATIVAKDEEGPVEKLEIFADGVLMESLRPELPTHYWTWAGLSRGPHVLVAQATDAGGQVTTSAPVRFTRGTLPVLLVTNLVAMREDTPSDPIPVRVSDTDTPVSQWGTLKLQATSSDPALLPPSGIVLSGTGGNRTLTLHPATNAFGNARIRVTVEDSHGLTATNEVSVVVEPVNDVPSVALTLPLDGTRMRIGEPVLLRAVASDVDGTISQVEFFDGSTSLGISPSPPFQLSWTNGSLGSHELSARAVDDGGGVGVSPPVRLTIELPPNEPPRFSPLGELQLLEDTPSTPVTFTVSDDRVGASSLALVATSLAPLVIADDGIALVPDGETWRLSVRPVTNQFGSGLIRLVATDPEGASSTNDVPFSVAAVDDPPVIRFTSPVEGAVYESGQSILVAVTATDSDSELTGLAIYDGSLAERLNPTVGLPVEFRWTNAAPGDHVLTARSRDASGVLSTSAPVRITVQLPVNRPPGVQLQPDALVTLEDIESAPVRVTVSDDRTPASEWVVLAKSLDPTLVRDVDVRLVRTGDSWLLAVIGVTNQSGAGRIELVVRDGEGASVTNHVSVTIEPVNDVPTISILSPESGALVPFGSAIRVEARAVDVEGDVARVRFLADGVVIGESTAAPYVVQWSGAAEGLHRLVAQVTDGSGASAESPSVQITVDRPPNQAPEIRLESGSVLTTEDTPGAPLFFTVADDRTPPEALTVRAESLDPALIPSAGLGLDHVGARWALVVSPLTNAFGLGSVRLIVTDADGASRTNDVPVSVQAVNDSPAITWVSPEDNGVFAPGTVVPVEVSVSDVEGPVSNVDFLVDGSVVGKAASAPFRMNWTAVGLGAHALAAVVQDSGGIVVTSSVVRVVVTPPANRPPTITGGSALTLYRDAVSAPIALTVGDDRTPLDQLRVEVMSTDPVLFPPEGLVLSGTGASRTLVIAPAPGAFGKAVVEVDVHDHEGLVAAVAMPVTVLPVSELPGGEGCFADRVPEGYGTFNMLKNASFRQEPGGDPQETSAVGSVELRAPPRYTIQSATVVGTGGFRVGLSRRDDGLYTWSNPTNEATLLRTMPFGSWSTSYRLSVAGESFTGFFPYAIVSNVPPVPRLLDLEAAQAINPASPFTLAWLPWTGSGTNDRVVFTVVDSAGNVALSAASDCSGQTVLPRNSAGLEIPAGRLSSDTSYTGYLTFGATQLAVNDKSPLLMLRAYHSRTTQFPLRTLTAGGGAAGVFGRPQVFGSSFVVPMRGTPGVTYRVESSSDLRAWTVRQEFVVPSSGSTEVAFPLLGFGPQQFMRAVVVPSP